MAGVDDITADKPSVEDFELRIFQLIGAEEKGVSDATIKSALSGVSAQQRAVIINRLLTSGRIDLLKSGSEILYKLKTETTSKVKCSDSQEKLVYQIIEEAGNKGIWVRDIRYSSNLLLTQVNKIVKNLESKKLIKAVKCVNASKKKVYMLFDLEPDRSLTGGAWYSEQDFESEFVDVLNQQCFKFLQQKSEAAGEVKKSPVAQKNASYASSVEIWRFINELGISKVELSVEDIETILNTLIYDGKVEMTMVAGTKSSEQKKLFRSVNPLIVSAGLMRLPCGVCPVIQNCHDGGVVSPSTCVYMTQWMDM